MPAKYPTSTANKRAVYTIRPKDIVEILYHRKCDESEEFLVRWRTNPIYPRPPRAVLSWHALSELDDCLHLVQLYLENINASKSSNETTTTDGPTETSSLSYSRKRKLSGDQVLSRDTANGLLTPANSADRSRSPSAERTTGGSFGPRVYNGILQRKEGRVIAKSVKKLPEAAREDVVTINSTTLPTPTMLLDASKAPTKQSELAIRMRFLELLKPVKGVQLQNLVDTTTPSLNFTFVDDYVLRDGVDAQEPEAYEGCVKKCKPNMGQNMGCEYTQWCECLEYAAVDERALERKDPKLHATYMQAKAAGEDIDTMGMPKRFPYSAPKDNRSVPQTLGSYYLEKREPVYECNHNCKCGPRCKSRVVQKGRKVPLTIFKTENRGWGVYCNEDLMAGEFIDTYLGEVITDTEADRRETESGKMKNSYFFSLDKFSTEHDGEIEPEDCFIVDGQYMGGPTRFINHSCEPNCKQYVVSFNKNDFKLYNLAFFAYENIRAGTELTFDYFDLDEVEEDEAIRRREEAEKDPENKDKVRCNCGTVKCRGFLW
ncbi:hypothetical protein M409DRAFT_50834 [Zasmidium cellare ATCC 36951]|uniref:SET domain-containing protein n=1 Tax=Zasmidium cellare ATCC 36951 TaxID=1080233 RepID=A0A6A6CYZ5_ZASCE|nr:uncharacterized protein M409DRAFT_50834 [Zasmidium cellare ATCC 36951]KAF2171388.1 hypothetical protein M409DRAFT_50834 [Zasmidium cellare ATCC 36951]